MFTSFTLPGTALGGGRESESEGDREKKNHHLYLYATRKEAFKLLQSVCVFVVVVVLGIVVDVHI